LRKLLDAGAKFTWSFYLPEFVGTGVPAVLSGVSDSDAHLRYF